MGYNCNTCGCSCSCNSLTAEQKQTNRTLVVPSKAMDNYELAKATGVIGPDTTINEYFAGLKGEPGVNGSGIQIEGNLNSYAELLAVVDPNIGDSYAVKTGDQALLYTYGENGWPAEGDGIPIQGEPGTDGNTYIPISSNDFFDI